MMKRLIVGLVLLLAGMPALLAQNGGITIDELAGAENTIKY